VLQPFASEIAAAFVVLEILLITFVITRIINVLFAWYSEKQRERKKDVSDHLLFILKKIIHAIVFIFAFFIILYTFNINLSGVVVGLGVGGIAIAFALQSILGDIFSAFTIYFDKPFEIGDFITIGSDSGTVKKIGIKSTRIQSLQGEELIVSNHELVNTRIRNFKQMRKRRINFSFGVIYDTPQVKLKKILEIVKSIIDGIDLADFERVHFKEFGSSSLTFDVVYYIKSKDYEKYMDTQQDINLEIKKAFEKEDIEMAFPTQTIYLKEEK
jgi:small-conductance mechanosensitive channel